MHKKKEIEEHEWMDQILLTSAQKEIERHKKEEELMKKKVLDQKKMRDQ